MQHNDPKQILAQSAVSIQSAIRTWNISNQYQIPHLPKEQLQDYPAYVVGNDPIMPQELNNYCEPNEVISFVGTGVARALSLALKLNPNHLPKVIIVDNSAQVIAFWRGLRDFMQDDTLTKTKELFTKNIKSFLASHRHLYRYTTNDDFDKIEKTNYLSQDIPGFFNGLFSKYNYDKVRRVIVNTSVIGQSWADRETFVKLKNILNHHGIQKIYAYPSDIVPCDFDKAKQDQILENIYSLSPPLTIHTNTCYAHQVPEKVILITNPEPSQVRMKLFYNHRCLYENTATERGLSLHSLLNIYFSSPDNGQNLQAFLKENSAKLKKF